MMYDVSTGYCLVICLVYYFATGMGVKDCNQRLYVCPLAYLKNHV